MMPKLRPVGMEAASESRPDRGGGWSPKTGAAAGPALEPGQAWGPARMDRNIEYYFTLPLETTQKGWPRGVPRQDGREHRVLITLPLEATHKG